MWKKRLPEEKIAVLIANFDDVAHDVHVEWWRVGSECRKDVSCTIRDLYAHTNLPVDISGGFTCVCNTQHTHTQHPHACARSRQ
eukprot:COSAG06_NODE_16935_length_972_cov_0.959908_2_plen_84_part_00